MDKNFKRELGNILQPLVKGFIEYGVPDHIVHTAVSLLDDDRVKLTNDGCYVDHNGTIVVVKNKICSCDQEEEVIENWCPHRVAVAIWLQAFKNVQQSGQTEKPESTDELFPDPPSTPATQDQEEEEEEDIFPEPKEGEAFTPEELADFLPQSEGEPSFMSPEDEAIARGESPPPQEPIEGVVEEVTEALQTVQDRHPFTFREAPASVNFNFINLEGRYTQWTLRDNDENRLAARYQAFLQNLYLLRTELAHDLPGVVSPPAPVEPPMICPKHGVAMTLRHNKEKNESWYSHQMPDGKWCRG